MPSSSRVHHKGTYPSPCATAPLRQFGSGAAVSSSLPTHPGAALGRLGVHVTNQPTWCWVRYSSAVCGLPGANVPGTLGGTRTCVGYYGEPGVLRDHGGSGSLYPFWHWWLSSLLPVWGGVDPMWWHWATWCGCPAVPGDAVGVFSPPRCTTPTMVAW